MESDGVSLPFIHEHSMVPWNDMGKGDCCGGFESITDGFYCEPCKFFVHKKCSESSQYIQHPSHSGHTLQLQKLSILQHLIQTPICNLCGKEINNLLYRCEICDFNIDLYCLKYPPPEVSTFPRRINTSSPFSRSGYASTVMLKIVARLVKMNLVTNVMNVI